MKVVSKSPLETRQVAQNFLSSLSSGAQAQVVALHGDLGAGKTTFTQQVGNILGIEEGLLSPTFVIMKVYDISFNGFTRLIHIDAYRLEKEEELLHLGWEELTKEPENLIFIEWPERVPNLIPASAQKIDLEFVDEETRNITIHG